MWPIILVLVIIVAFYAVTKKKEEPTIVQPVPQPAPPPPILPTVNSATTTSTSTTTSSILPSSTPVQTAPTTTTTSSGLSQADLAAIVAALQPKTQVIYSTATAPVVTSTTTTVPVTSTTSTTATTTTAPVVNYIAPVTYATATTTTKTVGTTTYTVNSYAGSTSTTAVPTTTAPPTYATWFLNQGKDQWQHYLTNTPLPTSKGSFKVVTNSQANTDLYCIGRKPPTATAPEKSIVVKESGSNPCGINGWTKVANFYAPKSRPTTGYIPLCSLYRGGDIYDFTVGSLNSTASCAGTTIYTSV